IETTFEQYFTSARGIIPVFSNFIVWRGSAALVDVSTPYFAVSKDGAKAIEYLKGISKVAPNVELIRYDLANLIALYGLKYNQVVVSDADFMPRLVAIHTPPL
ncbi:MAG: hypothetical protein NT036_02135, partial [Candidatus Omnitrophica bacterium]|nr:hypothetical protein [Candidatus Omnitrophota bacterium]